MKYVDAFDRANELRRILEGQFGYQFKDEVTRVAALAMLAGRESVHKQAEMVKAFEACRVSINPRWDGSIA